MITLQLKTDRCPPDADDIFFTGVVWGRPAELLAAAAGYRFYATCPRHPEPGVPARDLYSIYELGTEWYGSRFTEWSWCLSLARVVNGHSRAEATCG